MALAFFSYPRLLPLSSSLPPAPALTLRNLRFSEISLLASRNTLSLRRAMGSPDGSAERSKEITKAKAADQIGPMASGGSGFPLTDIPTWVKYVVGAIVCVALPFYKKILRIEATAQKDGIAIADVIEEVAEITEKIASKVADAAPSGEIKELALEVERFAESVDKDAEVSEAFIRKAAIIEDEVHKLMKPFVEEAEEIEKAAQVDKESSSTSKKDNSSTIISKKENISTAIDSSSTAKDSSKPT